MSQEEDPAAQEEDPRIYQAMCGKLCVAGYVRQAMCGKICAASYVRQAMLPLSKTH
jgi:hypothetical protein